ncbi:MAG: hypothetical protein OEN56_09400 [Gemmatimonadota bacterium]|nr:hypothetical protein [Gemmatimonadota bacterium]
MMRNDSFVTGSLTSLCFAVALSLFAQPLEAQNRDMRWMPFIGCWEAVGADDTIGLLCFAESDGGVELSNVLNGEVVSTEILAADGQRRSVAAEGCDGWETVEFSADGRRAFTRTEFTCAEGDARSGTGVMAFTSPTFWVDVRVLDVGGEEVAWVQEYLLAGADRLAEEEIEDPSQGLGIAVTSGRVAAAAPITLDDVEEASTRMGARAVETWVVALGDPLDVSAEDLVRLDEAGVSGRVIDAVVAVSHPDRFMVEAGTTVEQIDGAGPTHYRGYMGYNPWAGPAWGYGYEYGAFGYAPFYRYGYSPLRYGYPYGYGYGYGYYGSRPGVVIIDRRPRESNGRVYAGRGYRQGGTATGGAARPRGGSIPSFGRTGSRSGGSIAGSAGSGSRGSARTGRTARRRPPGGR